MNISVNVSRALDKYRESDYSVAATNFLSPAEKIEVYNELIARIGNGISRCFFWGGNRGAERCATVFLPEWIMPDTAPHSMPFDDERNLGFSEFLASRPDVAADIGIRCLKINGSEYGRLGHRDCLGSLMSLGVGREYIGDIYSVSEREARVLVSAKISDYVCSELKMVGRDAVKTEILEPDPVFEIPRRFETMTLTAASRRLDCIVKAITGKSREASAAMIRAGLVERSYITDLKPDSQVMPHDTLSIRGYGKYIIKESAGETRSGRLKIICSKYI